MELILMILGFLLHILVGMMKTQAKVGREFNFLRYLKNEQIPIYASLISAIILFLLMPEVAILFPSISTKIIAVIIGYANYSLFRSFWKTVYHKKNNNGI